MPSPESSISTLPPNISIFPFTHASHLLTAHLFTRLTVTSPTTPTQLSQVLTSHPQVAQEFCLTHATSVLIFDAAGQEDQHHEHFRVVCLALRDADIGLNVARCVHDAGKAVEAGFQFEGMKGGEVLVVDLMAEDDDDDESSDESEEESTETGREAAS